MVLLVSKEEINRLNIDTVERAIVFAALGLRQAIVRGDNTGTQNESVKITTSQLGANEVGLRLDVTLPYDNYKFVKSGGVILSNITQLDLPLPQPFVTFNFGTIPTPNLTYSLKEYPNNFPLTFESYFYYYACIFYASVAEGRNKTIKITPKGTGFNGAEVRVSITLPLNAVKWGLGSNLIECVEQVTKNNLIDFSYISTDNKTSILNNNIVLDNELILVN